MVVVDPALDERLGDLRLVPCEDESVVRFEQFDRVETALEDFMRGVVATRNVDADAHVEERIRFGIRSRVPEP